MAVTRKVIDQQHGVHECSECKGRGVKVQVIRNGPMIQQMQTPCGACGGQGKSFKTISQREVLEVHVPKGAPDNHRITFRGKADEHPDADTGDVIFVLKQRGHPMFIRNGADLFIERSIALVEALCGFSLEVTHLDGRRLLIQTNEGDIVKPLMRGFDPLAQESRTTEWEALADTDCPKLADIAQASTTDAEMLKRACEDQLKPQGIDVVAFVVKGSSAVFKSGTRDEILANKVPTQGATLYMVKDQSDSAPMRMMKAVKGEGMPTFKEPFRHGNLFLVLTVSFPESLPQESQEALRQYLPPPMNEATVNEEQENVEVHKLMDMDPLESYSSNKMYMGETKDASDEDEEGHSTGGGLHQAFRGLFRSRL